MFQIRVHCKTGRTILSQRMLLHNRILTGNRFLLFALLTFEKGELLPIGTRVLLHRLEHVSARGAELHLC